MCFIVLLKKQTKQNNPQQEECQTEYAGRQGNVKICFITFGARDDRGWRRLLLCMLLCIHVNNVLFLLKAVPNPCCIFYFSCDSNVACLPDSPSLSIQTCLESPVAHHYKWDHSSSPGCITRRQHRNNYSWLGIVQCICKDRNVISALRCSMLKDA